MPSELITRLRKKAAENWPHQTIIDVRHEDLIALLNMAEAADHMLVELAKDDDRMAAALSDNGTNYVANKESGPTEVRFSNGRRVWIAYEDGKPYLEVSMMAPGEAWLRNAADAEDSAGSVNIGSAGEVIENALEAAALSDERWEPRPFCLACNAVGASHCAHPDECGGIVLPLDDDRIVELTTADHGEIEEMNALASEVIRWRRLRRSAPPSGEQCPDNAGPGWEDAEVCGPQEGHEFCEYCGPICNQGACHNARMEAGDKWGTFPGESPKPSGPPK